MKNPFAPAIDCNENYEGDANSFWVDCTTAENFGYQVEIDAFRPGEFRHRVVYGPGVYGVWVKGEPSK